MQQAPVPLSVPAYSKVPAKGAADFRLSRLLIGMIGKRHTRHKVTRGGYRAQLDKSSMLRYVVALLAGYALPQEGGSKHSRPTTHGKLYRRMGYKWRESYTRNAARAPQLVKRHKFFAKASLYAWTFSEGSRKKFGEDSFAMPTAEEMRSNSEFAAFWEAAKRDLSGYDWIPGWIFHPEAPGRPHERLVLLALAVKGLFKVEGSRIHGTVQISEQTIAGMLGISRDTVARALRYWVRVGLLEIKEHPGRWELDGKPIPAFTEGATWKQPSNTIFYAPGRVFNQEQAVRERQRFLEASRQWQDSSWYEAAVDMHAATLKEWVGTQKKLSSFLIECRSRLRSLVPYALIDVLVPRGPD